MRIALVTGRYYPFTGGVETHVKMIATHLAKNTQDMEVEVLTTDPVGNLPKQEELEGVTIRRFKSLVLRDAYYLSSPLEHYLRKHVNGYQVIHAHGYHSFVPLYATRAIKAGASNSVFFFTPHYLGTGSTFLRKILHFPYRFIGKQIFSASNRTISLSKYERKLIITHFGIDKSRISIIPNGVDLAEISHLRKTCRKEKLVLSVCRLVKYKGLEVLLDAFSKLSGDFRLEIVGEGPFLKQLMKKVNTLRLNDKVFFYQRLPRTVLLQKFVDSDLFVLPSESEALPISLLEALASKTPCIVSNIPPLREWIDNENCYGIDMPIKAEKLASLMRSIIDRRVQGSKILSWDEVTRKLERAYLEETGEPQSRRLHFEPFAGRSIT